MKKLQDGEVLNIKDTIINYITLHDYVPNRKLIIHNIPLYVKHGILSEQQGVELFNEIYNPDFLPPKAELLTGYPDTMKAVLNPQISNTPPKPHKSIAQIRYDLYQSKDGLKCMDEIVTYHRLYPPSQSNTYNSLVADALPFIAKRLKESTPEEKAPILTKLVTQQKELGIDLDQIKQHILYLVKTTKQYNISAFTIDKLVESQLKTKHQKSPGVRKSLKDGVYHLAHRLLSNKKTTELKKSWVKEIKKLKSSPSNTDSKAR